MRNWHIGSTQYLSLIIRAPDKLLVDSSTVCIVALLNEYHWLKNDLHCSPFSWNQRMHCVEKGKEYQMWKELHLCPNVTLCLWRKRAEWGHRYTKGYLMSPPCLYRTQPRCPLKRPEAPGSRTATSYQKGPGTSKCVCQWLSQGCGFCSAFWVFPDIWPCGQCCHGQGQGKVSCSGISVSDGFASWKERNQQPVGSFLM